jgi:WD40 repeat protein
MGVAVTPNGSLAASCGRDATVRLWTFSGAEVAIIKLKTEVICVALAADGSRLVVGQGKQVWVLDAQKKKLIKAMSKHTGVVRAVALSPSGDFALSGSMDMTVMLWDMTKLEYVRSFLGHQGVIRGVCMSGSRAVSVAQDMQVRVWSLESGEAEQIMKGHEEDVRGCSISADGTLVATCSFDKTVRVWNVESGALHCCMDGHSDKVFGVSMSNDGKTVVSCSWDMSVRVWDVQSGAPAGKPMQPPSLLSRLTSSFRRGGGEGSVSLAERIRALTQSAETGDKRKRAAQQGFAALPDEAASSTAVMPEFGTFTSGKVLAQALSPVVPPASQHQV